MDEQMLSTVMQIMDGSPDLTLATIRPDGYPQATTISFAHRGLDIYAGIGKDSQKAHNLRHCNKVSLTIDNPYHDWNQIKGLSMAASAWVVEDEEESRLAAQCLQERFPQAADAWKNPELAGQMRFIHIRPELISVLDYEKGFGHTDLVRP